MVDYLVVRNWERFQHYKNRNPAWIKNYTELLSSDEYLGLTGHRRAILHGLWLEYAMSHARLTLDTRSISRQLSLRVTMADLEALNHAGFTEVCASAPLAPCAIAEVEEEIEKEPSVLPSVAREPGRNDGYELERLEPQTILEHVRPI